MCRNIKMLFNFDPPVTDEEVRAASLQYVRKISGFSKPSKANEAAFLTAIEEVSSASIRLLRSLIWCVSGGEEAGPEIAFMPRSSSRGDGLPLPGSNGVRRVPSR